MYCWCTATVGWAPPLATFWLVCSRSELFVFVVVANFLFLRLFSWFRLPWTGGQTYTITVLFLHRLIIWGERLDAATTLTVRIWQQPQLSLPSLYDASWSYICRHALHESIHSLPPAQEVWQKKSPRSSLGLPHEWFGCYSCMFTSSSQHFAAMRTWSDETSCRPILAMRLVLATGLDLRNWPPLQWRLSLCGLVVDCASLVDVAQARNHEAELSGTSFNDAHRYVDWLLTDCASHVTWACLMNPL